MSVKRYHSSFIMSGEMFESEGGGYVTFDDYSALLAKHNELVKENDRLIRKDGNASISLCYKRDNDPFASVSAKVCDFSYSENSYIVESDAVNLLISKHTALREAVEKEMSLEERLWKNIFENEEEYFVAKEEHDAARAEVDRLLGER